MQLLLYMAGAIGFLFLFFLSTSYISTNSYFQYLGYMCLLVVFFFLASGIRYYMDWNRETRKSKRQKAMERRQDYQTYLRKRIR